LPNISETLTTSLIDSPSSLASFFYDFHKSSFEMLFFSYLQYIPYYLYLKT
jgi:ssDNA-specific exonuclease RecJ